MVLDDTITFNPPDTGDEISFNPVPAQSGVPAAAVPSRAAKIDFTLGEQSPGVSAIAADLQTNGDQRMRDIMQQKAQVEHDARKLDMVNTIVKTQTGPVTNRDAQFTYDITQTGYQPQEHILEKSYANKMITSVAASNWKTYTDTEAVHPEVANKIMDVAVDIQTRNEIAQKEIQNIQSQADARGVFSKFDDFVDSNLPGSYMRMRNRVDTGEFQSLLPGKALSEQIAYLHSLPPDQFAIKFHQALDKIPNLDMKLDFAKSVVHLSDFDSALMSAQTIADLSGLAGTVFKGPLEKLAKKFIKAPEVFSDVPGPGSVIHPPSGVSVEPFKPNTSDVNIPGKVANDNINDTVVPFKQREGRLAPANDNANAVGVTRPDNDLEIARTAANRNQPLFTKTIPGIKDYVPPEDIVKRGENFAPPAAANDDGVRKVMSPETRMTKMLPEAANENAENKLLTVVKANDNADKLQSMMEGAVEAGKREQIDLGRIYEKTGRFDDAAFIDVMKEMDGIPIPGEEVARRNALSINGGSRQFFSGESEMFGAPTLRRLRDAALSRQSSATKAFDHIQVARDTKTNKATLLRQQYEVFVKNKEMQPLQESILDVGSTYDPKAQIDTMHVFLGKPNGELFSNTASAQKFIDDELSFAATRSSIVSKSGGFAIRMDHALPDALDAHVHMTFGSGEGFTKELKNGILKGFLGKLRGQNFVLGQANADARKAVVSGNQRLFEIYKQILTPLIELKGKELEELMPVFESNRDFVDYTTGNRGMFFDHVSQLNDAFNLKYRKNASEAQIDAYYAYVQANDFHYMTKDLGDYRDKVRRGIQLMSDRYTMVNKDGTTGEGRLENIEAKPIDRVPWEDAEDFRIGYKDSDGFIKTLSKNNAFSHRDTINDIVAKGGKVYQIADNRMSVMTKAGEKHVAYYVTDGGNTNPLKMASSYKPGGHVINDVAGYLKQAIIKDGLYLGDISWRGLTTRHSGAKLEDITNTARNMMNRIDAGEKGLDLDGYISKNFGGGMDETAFRLEFEPKQTRDGLKPGLDRHQPIVFVKPGQRSTGTALGKLPAGVINTQGSKHNLLHDMDNMFAGERDAKNLPVFQEEKGTFQTLGDGKLLSPIDTLVKAGKNIVDKRLTQEYLTKSANEWVAQFHGLLDQPLEQLRRAPKDALLQAKARTGADPVDVANMENARRQTLRFAGQDTEEGYFDTVRTALSDIVYDVSGKSTDNLPTWLMPLTKDPLQFMRATAYHAKMGMFNPIQLLLQAQTMTNVMAISPRAGFKAMGAMYPMRTGLINGSMLDHATASAVKSGWKREEFEEMFDGLLRAGWHRVDGSYATLDDVSNLGIFNGKVGKFLDAGTMFANEGERWNRLLSFGASYLEWKGANIGQKLDNNALLRVLSRADDMTVNMSAGNNAIWQKGAAAIPAQFFTYQLRLMEQYANFGAGKVLTPMEKLRLFTVHSAMYGIPVALGGPLGVWPIYESVKAHLMENSIPYDDNVTQATLNGIPQLMIKAATGVDANFGKRYGPGGTSLFRDLFFGDKTLFQTLAGSSGNIVWDAAMLSIPAMDGIRAFVTGDDSIYPTDLEHMTLPLRDISTVNNGYKLFWALNTGKAMTKYGTVVSDTTAGEAYTQALLGANPQRLEDMYVAKDLQADWRNATNAAKQGAQQWVNIAANAKDFDTRWDALQKARAFYLASGVSEDDIVRELGKQVRTMGVDQFDRIMQTFQETLQKRNNTKNGIYK